MDGVTTRIATGLAPYDGGVDAFAEAAGRAQMGLGGARADLVVVFAGASNLEHVEEGVDAVAQRLGAGALVGCGAQGVVGSGRELEDGGVVVWAASLPHGEVETFHLDATPTGEGKLAISGVPDLDYADAAIMLADPYTFPVEPLLAQFGVDHPGLSIMGGISSSATGPGDGVLMHDGAVVTDGAVGVASRWKVSTSPCGSDAAHTTTPPSSSSRPEPTTPCAPQPTSAPGTRRWATASTPSSTCSRFDAPANTTTRSARAPPRPI